MRCSYCGEEIPQGAKHFGLLRFKEEPAVFPDSNPPPSFDGWRFCCKGCLLAFAHEDLS